MNAYFLVEGKRTEALLYPAWLSHCVPSLGKIESPDRAQGNSYYLVSGEGYPCILREHLENSIRDIEQYKCYDYFVVVIDADEESVSDRKEEVHTAIRECPARLDMNRTNVYVIVQNRCIETWLLGNRRIFKRNCQNDILRAFCAFYDVGSNCPELLPRHPDYTTHSSFHIDYLRLMFQEQKIKYTKSNPGHALDRKYFEQLLRRLTKHPFHLATFREFIALTEMLKR